MTAHPVAKETSLSVKSAQRLKRTMVQRSFSVVGGVCAALFLLMAATGPLAPPAFAQSNDAKPSEKAAPAGQEAGKEVQKIDEFAEAQHALNGPAGNPECVWLGRRVVGLLWRDDLDTAFRHLDLYDRFGCPSAHIPVSYTHLDVYKRQAIGSVALDEERKDRRVRHAEPGDDTGHLVTSQLWLCIHFYAAVVQH